MPQHLITYLNNNGHHVMLQKSHRNQKPASNPYFTVRPDMQRWSAGKCKHHHHKGELSIKIPIGLRHAMLPHWIKRLASFNISARIVHRSLPHSTA